MPPHARQSRKTNGKSNKGSAWITFFVIVLCIVGLVAKFGKVLHLPDLSKLAPNAKSEVASAPPGKIVGENHFAPEENLEQLDYDRLGEAQRRVDIAMYAFTDRRLADELLRLARRGVSIRIYRDGEQYEQEERNARHYGDQTSSDELRGERNIQVRVKAASRRDLMHPKAYVVDARLLRDGSANWSRAGEQSQDNNARFSNDPAEIRAFESDFEQMWTRSDNLRVQ